MESLCLAFINDELDVANGSVIIHQVRRSLKLSIRFPLAKEENALFGVVLCLYSSLNDEFISCYNHNNKKINNLHEIITPRLQEYTQKSTTNTKK